MGCYVMRRKRQKKKNFMIFSVVCFFLLFFISSAYSLLNQEVVVSGAARIMSEQNSGGNFIENVLDQEDGLIVSDDGSSHFVGDSGDAVNNFIKIPNDSYLWRILSIDVEGNIKIIRNREDSLKSPFMEQKNGPYDWETSLILANLKVWYQNNLSLLNDIIIQNPEWLLTEASKSGGPTNVTVLSTFMNSPIGLIRNDEILNSSGGTSNGNSVSSWLNDGYQWTMTAVSGNPKQAWRMNGDKFMNSGVDTSSVYRPVIILKSSTMFSGGTGTENDPFVIE